MIVFTETVPGSCSVMFSWFFKTASEGKETTDDNGTKNALSKIRIVMKNG